MTWGYAAYALLLIPALAIGYVAFAGWQTRRLVQSCKSAIGKLGIAAIVASVFLLIPTWDVIKGRVTFNRLCDMHAGRHVYKTIALDESYFDSYGSPKWDPVRVKGVLVIKIAARYTRIFSEQDMPGWPRITQLKFTYVDEVNGDVIGESINFIYWGGWVSNSMPGHHTGEICKNMRTGESMERLIFQSVAK